MKLADVSFIKNDFLGLDKDGEIKVYKENELMMYSILSFDLSLALRQGVFLSECHFSWRETRVHDIIAVLIFLICYDISPLFLQFPNLPQTSTSRRPPSTP